MNPLSDEKILVLAGKQVGLDCLTHLIAAQAPIDQVVAGTTDDQAIVDLCQANGLAVTIYDKGLEETLSANGGPWSWILSLWNPHILGARLLARASNTLNLHPALVPHCRGNDTAAWALAKTLPAGVSLLEMDEGVDTGGVWAQRPVEYTPLTRGRDLFQILQRDLTDLFKTSWADIFAGHANAQPQQGPVSAHTRKQTNKDRVRVLDDDSAEIRFLRWARAHDFAPGSTAEIVHAGKRYKLTIDLQEISAVDPAKDHN